MCELDLLDSAVGERMRLRMREAVRTQEGERCADASELTEPLQVEEDHGFWGCCERHPKLGVNQSPCAGDHSYFLWDPYSCAQYDDLCELMESGCAHVHPLCGKNDDWFCLDHVGFGKV